MDNRLKKILLPVLLLLILASIFFRSYFMKQICYFHKYEEAKEQVYNPYIGFAPCADYKEAVGKNTLVYVEVTFKEAEPEENVFAFSKIEEKYNLKEWKNEGKNVVFRFLCDKPGKEAHKDIPEWLYEKTGDGQAYDMEYGKGYAPDYNNPVLIREHQKVITALGDYFGKDNFFYYIEFGSIGHWGEWHVKSDEKIPQIPQADVCQKYIDPYFTAFPHAHFLFRRPYHFQLPAQVGIYNDLTGDEKHTKEWLTWIQKGGSYDERLFYDAKPKIWNTAPVGGEFTSEYAMEFILTEQLKKTISLVRATHMSFIGPNCPIANEEEKLFPEKVAQLRKNLGYNYGVSYAEIKYRPYLHKVQINCELFNYGTVPIYEDWNVFLCLYDEEKQEIIEKEKIPVRLSQIMEREKEKISISFESELINKKNIQNERVAVGIYIQNPENEMQYLKLNMETDRRDNIYFL